MIIGIGLLLTLVAIPALYSLVQNEHVASIYVINLLISDLLQFCCMIADVAQPASLKIFYYIYLYSLAASVCFMVGIALERYLVIVFPVWYRCRRTIKTSVVICVMAWALSAFHPIAQCFSFNNIMKTIDIVFLLLPLPPLIFFLVGTLKALSTSISVPADEKRRIVGTLVLVLLIYTLLFLPNTILAVLNRMESIDVISIPV
ncbi:hypothetical protein PFLUV_G00104250 [Perca fluviatilis]|uniref:G-protein coupled receptors family 1 profile domain-containing protein n=1 Tax=Perca fluviatilis TaxID=8168 RepID=A0A6A5FCN4_PERFL|nr:G-protein coupled receptor 4-like isoform X2 [Perca fluviatilis]KAF1387324.1 hypothetical protein PFLUV_G00104250 [Perca fluviatilis]